MTERVRVRVPVDEPEEDSIETLWAVPVSPGVVRLDSIPLLAFGMSRNDTVEVRERAGALELTAVLERGGHSTYRVMLTPWREAEGESLLREIVRTGCGYESLSERFHAIDVPHAVDVHAVYRVLQRGLKDQIWTFEEGHFGRESSSYA